MFMCQIDLIAVAVMFLMFCFLITIYSLFSDHPCSFLDNNIPCAGIREWSLRIRNAVSIFAAFFPAVENRKLYWLLVSLDFPGFPKSALL